MTKNVAELPTYWTCHDVEAEVRRELLATSGVKVSSLVVRRLPNGVCLQGVLHLNDASVDIGSAIRRVPGIQQILNRMVICQDSQTPS